MEPSHLDPTSSSLRERILAAARATPAPTRQASRWRTALTIGLGLASMGVVFVLMGGVRLENRPLELVFVTAFGALAVAGVGFWLAFGRGGSMLGRTPRTLIWMSVVVPLVLFGWKLGASASCGLDEWWPTRPGLRCLVWSLLMGSGFLAALIWLRRRSIPRRPALVGVALGSAVGACTWVLTDLWCPVAHPAHLLLGHIAPLVILSAAGGIIGSRVLPPRK